LPFLLLLFSFCLPSIHNGQIHSTFAGLASFLLRCSSYAYN
jgi:hypothetical protein